MEFNQFIIDNEVVIRVGFFFGILIIIGLWELIAPCRQLTLSKALRWGNNLLLIFLNNLILRLLFPAAAVGVAALADQREWGILNYFDVPAPLSLIVAVIALDLAIYLQHVMVHAIPVLWRLHRVHHADPDYDVTTGARFHPIEIILSMLIKFAVIMVLGPSVVAVVIFEVMLNGTAMFNHGNLQLPKKVDAILRLFVVTPDMHRVHHSVEDDETNSNFGFSLPWWDRLFGTYRAQPRKGHQGMTIGIHQYNDPKEVSWLTGMLTLPFKGKISSYVINRRQWNSDKEDNS